MRSRYSLQNRLTLVICLFAIATITISYLVSSANHRSKTTLVYIDKVMDDTAFIQGVAERYALLNYPEGITQMVSNLGARPDTVAAYITGPSGIVIASIHYEDIGALASSLSIPPHEESVSLATETRQIVTRLSEDGAWLDAYASVCTESRRTALRPVRCGFLFQRINLDYHIQQGGEVLWNQITGEAIGLGVMAFLLWLFLRLRVSQYVNDINTGLSRFASGDRIVRVRPFAVAEFASMAEALNALFENVHANEEKIIESERMQKAILATAADAIISIGQKGEMRLFNEAAERIFGYSQEEVIGKNVSMLMTSPYREEHDGYLSRYLRTGERHIVGSSREVTARRKNGQVFPILLAVSEIKSADGVMFTGLIKDISNIKEAEDKLRESQERLDLALTGASLGVWDWNTVTNEAFFNERWASMFGYELAEIEPKISSWANLLHPDDKARVMKAVEGHLEGKTGWYETEHRVKAKDGSWIWILDKGKVVDRGADGKPLRMAGTHLDITGRKIAEARLERTRQELQAVLASIPDLFFLLGRDGVIKKLVSGPESLLHLPPEELIGKSIEHTLPPAVSAHIMKGIEQAAMEEKAVTVEYEMEVKQGKLCFEARLLPIGDKDIAALVRDISDRKRLERILRNQSLKDGLTNLYNRRAFDEALAREWKQAQRDGTSLSLILIDIDHFKLYNDHYGHQEGDACLVAVAGAIQRAAARPSDVAARYGGEEFVVILPDSDIKAARIVAENIRQAVSSLEIPHEKSSAGKSVTVSLGAASVSPGDGEVKSADLLVKIADKGLYQAKESGRNRIGEAQL